MTAKKIPIQRATKTYRLEVLATIHICSTSQTLSEAMIKYISFIVLFVSSHAFSNELIPFQSEDLPIGQSGCWYYLPEGDDLRSIQVLRAL